eukprot:CAMPEP_0185796372 /NCGR_PEP_ID=MMETSP1174-20130828/161044_1 /TAXON_ID=35687 /ORGANISM="Dictyocha speculum, Strain CCMP1381" /LENGTH=248 /DNA_ID=CAMNT_0028491727 /DNA_START=522 /DNA_END=1268 /DNA_ORIENTATION=-
MQAERYHRTVQVQRPFSHKLPKKETTRRRSLHSSNGNQPTDLTIESSDLAHLHGMFPSLRNEFGGCSDTEQITKTGTLSERDKSRGGGLSPTEGNAKKGSAPKPKSASHSSQKPMAVRDHENRAPALGSAPGSERVSLSTPQISEQQLMQENALLVASLEGELDDVRKVETGMREVAELMNLFSLKVAEQTEAVQAIEEKTTVAADNLDQGHEQLVKAAERSRSARHAYVGLTLILSILMLILDSHFP